MIIKSPIESSLIKVSYMGATLMTLWIFRMLLGKYLADYQFHGVSTDTHNSSHLSVSPRSFEYDESNESSSRKRDSFTSERTLAQHDIFRVNISNNNPPSVAFFHIPKTAGSTLESALTYYSVCTSLVHDTCYKWHVHYSPTCNSTTGVIFGHISKDGVNGGLEGGGRILNLSTPATTMKATVLRDGVSRHISHHFYMHPNSNASFEEVFGNFDPNYQYKQLFGVKAPMVCDIAQELLLNSFQLLGLTERIDESLVVWQNFLQTDCPFHYLTDYQDKSQGGASRAFYRSYSEDILSIRKKIITSIDSCLMKIIQEWLKHMRQSLSISDANVSAFSAENQWHEVLTRQRIRTRSSHAWKRDTMYSPLSRSTSKCSLCAKNRTMPIETRADFSRKPFKNE